MVAKQDKRGYRLVVTGVADAADDDVAADAANAVE
jgi:hypothetical protein